MSRADYAHHNEEQDRIWWEEEGKHEGNNEPSDPDPGDYDHEEQLDDSRRTAPAQREDQ